MIIYLLLIIELNVDMNVLYAFKWWQHFIVFINDILIDMQIAGDIIP